MLFIVQNALAGLTITDEMKASKSSRGLGSTPLFGYQWFL
jgi:hypothetical protein